MAILYTVADGSEQHYDTIEEFEKAMILMKRLNGEKVPQDLLDEVREKYDGKDPKTSQVEIDGPQDLEALGKAVEAFFKRIDDTEEDVNMENLPIGTVVKVVDNASGHFHCIGEILPITEVDNEDEPSYRLDDRISGWVNVEEIEFVSFPEEEESTSGDEGLTVGEVEPDKPEPKSEVGDTVKVLRNTTEGFDEGTIGKVVEILPSGSLMIESDCGGPYAHSGSALELVEESEDSEIKAGDIVIATEDELDITEGVEYEIREDVDGGRYFLDDDGDIRHVSVHEEILRKKIIEAIDEPKIEVGDILRCNKDSMYVTEGKLYEVLAIDRDGDAVYMVDDNSVSFVNETDIPERFEIL